MKAYMGMESGNNGIKEAQNGHPPFRNVPARSREERDAAGFVCQASRREKPELIGKLCGSRLIEQPLAHPLQTEKGCPSFVDESERFERDSAAAEQGKRTEKLRAKEEYLAQKRIGRWEREADRWERIQCKQDNEEATAERWRHRGMKSKKNESGEHFNILTLEYLGSAEGQRLQYMDDMRKYKDVLRAYTLHSKSHSSNHNIITGQLRDSLIELPSQPQPPETAGDT